MAAVVTAFRTAGLTALLALMVLALVPPAGAAPLPPLRIQVERADATRDSRTGEPVVVIHLSPRSGRMLRELTLKHIGRRLVVRVDGKVVAEPVIREAIDGGTVQISGNFTPKDAADMAARLNNGAAKVEVELVD